MSEWSLTKTGKTTLSTYRNQKLWVLAMPRRSFDKKTRKIKKKINGALRIFAPPATLNEEILDQFRHAPGPKQLDFYRFSVSSALDVKLPDEHVARRFHAILDLVED